MSKDERLKDLESKEAAWNLLSEEQKKKRKALIVEALEQKFGKNPRLSKRSPEESFQFQQSLNKKKMFDRMRQMGGPVEKGMDQNIVPFAGARRGATFPQELVRKRRQTYPQVKQTIKRPAEAGEL